MLRVICNKLDAVVLTHEHMDHVAGLDDVRGASSPRGERGRCTTGRGPPGAS
jgi:phosphoribosyl 1,2-cyclic phosphodiesterase